MKKIILSSSTSSLQCCHRGIATQSAQSGLIGPAVRLMLHHYQLNPEKVNATGPKNNLLKSDLLSYIKDKKLAPKPVILLSKPQIAEKAPSALKPKVSPKTGASYVDIPLTNMRSTIAKRLSQAKGSIPHAYLSASIPANKVTSLRKMLANDGIKVSVNDFVIKAASLSLRSVPQINVQWKGEKVSPISSVDVSVAVATPSGLITPIIFNADRLGIQEISSRVQELAGRAKENKLKPEEFMGGTFTISNLGMFGISHFTAIINPPQTAILAVGGLQTEVDEHLNPENIAQRFLSSLQIMLAEPNAMVMGTEKFVDNIDELSALL
ncbi:2-oxoacid dehydrogenases acyltransferase (catalytic domain) domain-containing protein [Ditylenchus destructor]|uniref:2-oxoacid dehydrogenases acyltransferase (Catalytic domain) domain-containing protein n=1 Tax=Ditylenchus destructor TaxID=166010 RepID=A0AAD4NIQ0_9BILA|nr:2-oxoacid dehydrogenases acyltransferase (catalytic domain) domain-containing protein [Ditylenchus destructor]